MMKKAVLLLLICLSNGWLLANHWTPNDSGYEDNMTLTGIIQIDGVEQQSTTLEVGVFCGEECRGAGYSTYFVPMQCYVIQLLVFGEVGDQLTFKLYDSDLGQELDLVSPDAVSFNANGYGSLSNPYVLNFTESSFHWTPNGSSYEDNMTLIGIIQINGIEQFSTALEVGVFCGGECRGSGYPTYFPPMQRYVVQLLIFGEVGDHLTFRLYDSNMGQELGLISPDAVTFNANGYGLLADPYTLNFTGDVGESCSISANVSPAVGGTVQGTGAYQLGQTCTLMATPNEGCIFSNWTENGIVVSTNPVYSFSVTSNRTLIAHFTITESNTHWTPNESSYEDNMTLIGVIQIDGVEQQSTALEVGVFCGEECRGTALPIYFFPTQRYIIQLLIFGESGDKLTFKLYDHDSGQELDLTLSEPITFNTNGSGTLADPIILNITDNGHIPWVPNDSSYEDNMTLTGVIQINGVEQQSTTLEVGVFCGEECRGTGMATYFFPTQRYVVQLLIFGEIGDQLTFKLYDHSTGQEYEPASQETITFIEDGYGNPIEPYVLKFSGEPSTITQTIQLSQGWNWFSTYLDITLDDLKAALVSTLPGTNISINSQGVGSTTYANNRWRGTLTALDLSQMYMINVTADCEMTLVGVPIDPSVHPVTIHPDFNWMAFPLSQGMTLTNVFEGFAVNGDMVISQAEGSSTYTNRWRGTLSTLEPGRGYMYKSTVTVGDRVFTFPISTK